MTADQQSGYSKQLFVFSLVLIVLGFSSFAFGQDAAATFKTKCAMCHAADGGGKTAMGAKFGIPDLRAPEIQKKSRSDLATTITKGKNKMPSFGKLTQAEITDLASYIQRLKPEAVVRRFASVVAVASTV